MALNRFGLLAAGMLLVAIMVGTTYVLTTSPNGNCDIEKHQRDADLGHADDITALAVMYSQGICVEQDPVTAAMWIHIHDRQVSFIAPRSGIGDGTNVNTAAQFLFEQGAEIEELGASINATLNEKQQALALERAINWVGPLERDLLSRAESGDADARAQLRKMYNYRLIGGKPWAKPRADEGTAKVEALETAALAASQESPENPLP